VRGVERIGKTGTTLAIVSEHVPGVRLSEILAFAESRLFPIETNAALCLIRQLIHALALLHQKMPDVCHGAVGPERIIVTPHARLVLVEHVLGAALGQLHYTHEQYWKTLRIPLARTGSGPQFDRRSDITQAGVAFAHPAFDTPPATIVGFMTHKPPTEDYVPLFPWLGVVFVGIGLGTLWQRAHWTMPAWLQRWNNHPPRLLVLLGTWALTVYLIHQPLMLGALALVRRLAG